MTSLLTNAQIGPDTSSAAAVIFGIVFLIGGIGILGVTTWGRRHLLPLVSILLGAAIAAMTFADASWSNISVITLLGLFIAFVLIMGGIGAFREGVALPDVTRPDDNEK